MQDPVYGKTKNRDRVVSNWVFFYSDALKITWFSLDRWRASLKGKRLRKLINIRGFVIKTSFVLLRLALLRVVTRKFVRSTWGCKSISIYK